MNSYELSLTAPSRQRVYRFHHLGTEGHLPTSTGTLSKHYAVPFPALSNHSGQAALRAKVRELSNFPQLHRTQRHENSYVYQAVQWPNSVTVRSDQVLPGRVVGVI